MLGTEQYKNQKYKIMVPILIIEGSAEVTG